MIKVKILLIAILCIANISLSKGSDAIKIMPVGNSITAGEHYHFPANEERTGYRKDLYEMLINAGYSVDFVGSQTHGIRPTTDPDWYDWNNEAYPGWKIPDIAGKLKSALGVYKPDILLVHVGTNGNDWSSKPAQVMDMLNSINQYSVENDHPITVFLCKIIKLYIELDSDSTSKFNDDIAELVAARTGDKIKIIMVDMENGAGLDYSDALPDSTANPPYEGGDMWGYTYPGMTKVDKYHPNDKGNHKMAVKFYNALVKELKEPDKIENNMVEGIELHNLPDSSISISWSTNFLDEDGYIIERTDSGGDFTIVDTVSANSFSYIDISAIATQEYRYRIKAFNAAGESQYSSEVTYTPMFFTLTVSVLGEGSVSPEGGSFLVGTKAVVELTATAAEGWEFEKWTSDHTYTRRSSTTIITVDEDFSITASFIKLTSNVSIETGLDYIFYPNPVNNNLTIELQDEFSRSSVIQLYDSAGKLILNRKVQGLKHILDLDNLFQGTYLINVTNNQGKIISKHFTKL